MAARLVLPVLWCIDEATRRASRAWRVAVALLGATVGGCSACDPCQGPGCTCDEDGVGVPCAEPGICPCADQDVCDIACPGGGCEIDRDRLDTCDAQCLADCDWTCRDVTDCAVGCDAGCGVVCDRVSSCEVACGDDCVTCRDAGACETVMGSGTALCERVGGCEVRCVNDEGDESPAEACGDRRFACGGCP